MEKPENLYKLAFLLILVFAAGITGISPVFLIAFAVIMGFFFYDTWGEGNSKIIDMVNILVLVLAVAIFALQGGFSGEEKNMTTPSAPATTVAPNNIDEDE